jgi:hypothetical protein
VSTVSVTASPVHRTRLVAGAIAAFVLFDTIWVRAPFLAFLAVPFAVAAGRFRDEHRITNIALLAWSGFYVALGVMFAVTNGLHAPAEVGQAREAINPGDFAFAYLGTPAAAWLALRLGRSALRPRSHVVHASPTAA